ncbi:hypothetical protein ABCY62_09495 [Acetivibrio clariflavus]|uniref:hypothetical protein n=1 Tax=Acetivibrio clariflavus TaxID=288965 RepID=UPI0031F5B534
MEQSRVIAIYGKKEFGKTNLLNLLLSGFAQQKQEAEIVFFDDSRNQLEPIYNNLKDKLNCKLINKFEEIELRFTDDSKKTRKLSPLQQFYVYLNEKHISLDKPNYMADIYGVSKISSKEYLTIPDCYVERAPFTVFVIQSKLVYLDANENKRFINTILPQLVSVAEERGYLYFPMCKRLAMQNRIPFLITLLLQPFCLIILRNLQENAGKKLYLEIWTSNP